MFQKSVLGIQAILESGKSCAIPVCLSESCLSHDITRALRYWISEIFRVGRNSRKASRE